MSEGQPLIETGTADRQRLDEIRGREQAATAGVEQSQARIRDRLRMLDEEIGRLQQSNLPTEVQLAQSIALQARTGALRAEADLAKLTAPPSADDVRVADQQIRVAELAYQRAAAESERLAKGPSDADLRKAENDVAAAELAVSRAVDALEDVVSGPDPRKVSTAKREVQRAQEALQVAQRQPPEVASAQALILASRNGSSRERRAARDAAREQVDAALRRQRLEIQRAEDRLTDAIRALQELTQAPDAQELQEKWRAVGDARENLAAARERLAAVQAGPSEAEIGAAEAAANVARLDLEQARARRAALDAGPPADQLATARAAVTSARAALSAADERATDLSNRQRSQEQRQAEAQAQKTLLAGIVSGAVNSLAEAAKPDPDPDIVAFAQAQTDLARARADLAELGDNPEPSTLVAPAAGTIVAVLAGPGEDTGPDRPALTMVRTPDLMVEASLEVPDGGRVVQGMSARVRPGTMTGTDLAATVDRTDRSEGGRIANLSVTWSPPPPAVGTAARVLILLERRDNALLVPVKAIRMDTGRAVVEVTDGAAIQRVEVPTGLSDGVDVELLGGVQEGQRVLIGP